MILVAGGAWFFYFNNSNALDKWHQQSEGFEEARKLSAESGKPILMFVNSPNCAPCRKLKDEFFTKSDVLDLLEEKVHTVNFTANTGKIVDMEWYQKFPYRTIPQVIIFRPGSSTQYESIPFKFFINKDIDLEYHIKLLKNTIARYSKPQKTILSETKKPHNVAKNIKNIKNVKNVKTPKIPKTKSPRKHQITPPAVIHQNQKTGSRLVAYLSPNQKAIPFIYKGQDAIRERNFKDGLRQFQKALRYDKTHQEVWHGIGYCQMMLAMKKKSDKKKLAGLKQAKRSFEKALKHTPGHPDSSNYLIQINNILQL